LEQTPPEECLDELAKQAAREEEDRLAREAERQARPRKLQDGYAMCDIAQFVYSRIPF